MSGADCRCTCGKLVARATPDGLDLKCRGCKRTVHVARDAGGWRLSTGDAGIIEIVQPHPSGRRPSTSPAPAPVPLPAGR